LKLGGGGGGGSGIGGQRRHHYYDDDKPIVKPTFYMFADKFQEPKCKKEGWLTKQGEMHKNWKKRYFCLLEKGHLYYFNSEEAPVSVGFCI